MLHNKILRSVFIFSAITIFISGNYYGEGGSLYSRIGVGTPLISYSARNLAFGELGAAVYSEYNVGGYNPAGWAGIPITRTEAGINYNGLGLKDASTSTYYSGYHFSGFTVAFPIQYSKGITLSLGLLPYTKVDYEVVSSASDREETFSGQGSISKAYFGLSYKTPFDMAVGAVYEYYMGKIDFQSNTDFYAAGVNTAIYSNESSYFGGGYRIGIISPNMSELLGLNSKDLLLAGLVYSGPVNLTTDTALVAVSAYNTKTLSRNLIETELPYSLGFGLSYQKEKLMYTADLYFQPWSEYHSNGLTPVELKNLTKISLGMEYNYKPGQFLSFWEQIVLRAGLTYEQTQYRIDGTDLSAMGISAGAGIPLSSTNRLDIGFMFASRGKAEGKIIKENIYNLFFTLSFGDFWFVQEER